MRLCILPAVLLSMTISLGAQSFLPDQRVNDDSAGTKQIAPRVALDSSGTIYIAWSDFSTNPNGDLYISRSTDRGVSFSPATAAVTGGSVPSGMQRAVQMAVTRSGTLHLVWLHHRSGGIPDVLHSRSTDGGVTFSTPVSIAGDGPDVSQDMPSLTTVGDTLHVAFVDDRELLAGGGEAQIYATRSTDDGVTFSPPVRASFMPGEGGSCECCNTSIAALPSGLVAISFRGNVENNRDVTVARSFDGGVTFAPSVIVASENWFIPACPMTGSSIALDRNGTAHVAWRDSRPSANGKDYIYYTKLRAGESAAEPDRRISATTKKSNYPSLVLLPNGGVTCAWQDNRSDASDIFAAVSTDGGATFSTDGRLHGLSPSPGRQEEVTLVAGASGDIYAVWADTRRDAGDIHFARDTTTARTIAAVPVESASVLTITPHPLHADQAATVTVRSPAGSARFTLYDMMGGELFRASITHSGSTTIALPTERLVPGIYICTVTGEGGEVVQQTVVVE